MLKKIFPVMLSMGALLAGQANAGIIEANGSGWCTTTGCNSNQTTISNHYAGRGDIYRNFFNFDLSGLSGKVTSAKLSIWNSSSHNTPNFGNVYTLYAARELNYAGLIDGALVGSVLDFNANTGLDHYVEFVLNQDGLTALQNLLGKQFLFGGRSMSLDGLFGYTNGMPVATLDIETTLVPEPAGVALLGLGLVAFASVRRKS